RFVQVPFHTVRNFGQLLPDKLQKVWRGTMCFQGGVILVPFTNEKTTRLGLVAVKLGQLAAGFVTRLLREFRKKTGYFVLVPYFRHPRHSQNDHCIAPCNYADLQLSPASTSSSLAKLRRELIHENGLVAVGTG